MELQTKAADTVNPYDLALRAPDVPESWYAESDIDDVRVLKSPSSIFGRNVATSSAAPARRSPNRRIDHADQPRLSPNPVPKRRPAAPLDDSDSFEDSDNDIPPRKYQSTGHGRHATRTGSGHRAPLAQPEHDAAAQADLSDDLDFSSMPRLRLASSTRKAAAEERPKRTQRVVDQASPPVSPSPLLKTK